MTSVMILPHLRTRLLAGFLAALALLPAAVPAAPDRQTVTDTGVHLLSRAIAFR